MWRRATVAVVVLAMSWMISGAAQGDDHDLASRERAAVKEQIGKVQKLMDIGDYPAAVAQLAEMAAGQPTNVQVRLLLATCFAKCEYDLQFPGPVSVGQNNNDRAMFEFGILARLGKEGVDALLGAIADKDEKVAELAIRTAGKFELKAAVDALIALDENGEAISALAQIKGEKAAAVFLKHVATQPDESDIPMLTAYAGCLPPSQAGATIRAMISKSKGSARSALIDLYLKVLDEAGLVKVATTEKDKDILRRMCASPHTTSFGNSNTIFGAGIYGNPTPDSNSWANVPAAALEAMAQRTDLPDAYRVSAIEKMVAVPQANPSGTVTVSPGFPPPAKRDTKSQAQCLAELVNDPSADVAWAAVKGLVAVDPDKAVGPLVVMMEKDESRNEAIRLLCQTKSPIAIAPLMTVFGEMADPKKKENYSVTSDSVLDGLLLCGPEGDLLYKVVKLALANGFSITRVLPSDALPEIIDKLLGEKDAAIRRQAMDFLPGLDPKDWVAEVSKAMGDKDAEVRNAAGEQMLRLVDMNRCKPSQAAGLLESSNEALRQQAAEVLARKGDASLVGPFLALLKDTKAKDFIRANIGSIAQFFARHPDARAVGPMIAVFMGPTATWDEKGLENLAKAIKAGAPDLPAAAKEVARGLADNSSNVRTRAAMVLGSLGEKSVLPQLKEAAGKFVLGTPERQAIDAAIRELGGEVK